MLRFFNSPGRALMRLSGRATLRRPNGALPAILSAIVYLLVAGLILWLVVGRARPVSPPPVALPASMSSDVQAADVQAAATPSSAAASPAVVAPAPPLTGPDGFVPLQSQAVKDAIHRALATGTTQRWADGKLSGYAVPSVTTGANGCRAVRYTIDQQPDTPYASITACDASAH